MQLKTQLTNAVKKAKLYWRSPMPGRYMPYKEIVSLSVGGIGVKLITYCTVNLLLSAGNEFTGNTIGIEPGPLYVLYLLSLLSSVPLTALRARMIDNTKSMKGKYRPYVLSMGIPTAILAAAFVWMPYEHMSQPAKYAAILLFNIGFQFFYKFMLDAHESLPNVLSPNTVERSDVNSIKSVVENFAPSIAGIFMPLFARMITGQDTLFDLQIFRWAYPPMLLIGLLLTILIHVNTKEKIVQPKSREIQVRFVDALRAVARNKYFWILSLGSWVSFLEEAANNLLKWLYNYQKVCTAAQFSLVTAIHGNAGFWPNLIAPVLVRKIGKRNILIYTNLLNIVFLFVMYPVIRYAGNSSVIWWILLCMFVNGVTTAVGHNIGPGLNADMRDYQQYITGERIDGMFAARDLVGNIISLATGAVLPFLYNRAGLNRETAVSLGYSGSNVYDVLYDPGHFVSISRVLILAAVVGSVLNVIPYFWYDLTETKQRAMVAVLKIRAYFEDLGTESAREEDAAEALTLMEEAKAFDQTQSADKEQQAVAQYIMAELNRFETSAGQQELAIARRIAEAGPQGFTALDLGSVAEAKALPASTPEEKERRQTALSQARDIQLALKIIRKHYPGGMEEFDRGIFDTLFTAADEVELTLHACSKELLQAKMDRDSAAQIEVRNKMTLLRAEKTRINQAIKQATKQNSIYNLAAKPYVSAKRLLVQAEHYRQQLHVS